MILKPLVSVLALGFISCAPKHEAVFAVAINDLGRTVFDLRMPNETWLEISHGMDLDINDPKLSPSTKARLHLMIESGMQKLRECPDGWMMGRTRIDFDGTHHFRGLCISSPIRT